MFLFFNRRKKQIFSSFTNLLIFFACRLYPQYLLRHFLIYFSIFFGGGWICNKYSYVPFLHISRIFFFLLLKKQSPLKWLPPQLWQIFHIYFEHLWWCNGLQGRQANVHEWVRVSLGAHSFGLVPHRSKELCNLLFRIYFDLFFYFSIFWRGFSTNTLMSNSCILVPFFVSKEAVTFKMTSTTTVESIRYWGGGSYYNFFFTFSLRVKKKTFIFFLGWSRVTFLWNVSLLNPSGV